MPAERELELGTLLVRAGCCTAEQVRAAVELQRSLEAGGQFRRLGELLVEAGAAQVGEVARALAEAGTPIWHCDACGL
ncbi:MAG: hypothetical protein HZA54_10670, partial [Planctomycetes bacterium]|nr:hypothetical protein [Planctomycetota bacterium]